jgi:hypothetical protein
MKGTAVKKIIVAIVIAVSLAFFGIWYASPYFASSDAMNASRSADLERLGPLLDLDSIKANMHDGISSGIDQSIAGSLLSSLPFGNLSLSLVDRAVGVTLNHVITPDVIASLLDGRPVIKLPSLGGKLQPEPGSSPESDWSYQDDHDYFILRVHQRQNPSDYTVFTFYRESFTAWRIASIELPKLKSLVSLPNKPV